MAECLSVAAHASLGVKSVAERVAYSFVVDEHPKFAYQAWHLAKSLKRQCEADAADIHVQMTPEVPAVVRKMFAAEGFQIHGLSRFGDGRWCNKLGQLPNLLDCAFDRVVLLDTDMIAVSDLRPFLQGNGVQAKIVDAARPSLEALNEICRIAGKKPASSIRVDATNEYTMKGNANGGFYAIPRALAGHFSTEWRRWALWLLENDEPLRREGHSAHVDQVSAALAFHISGIPWLAAPSNVNYFLHFQGKHRYLDRSRPIALVHYHDVSMNVVGLVQPDFSLSAAESAAILQANTQITQEFNNVLFWNFRYAAFPERGSGIGSRGENLQYKHTLLRNEGIEEAESILDVGCGDGEVLRGLSLRNYLGIDVAAGALEKARIAMPNGTFMHYEGQPVEPREVVLCFEVLIHQPSLAQFHALVDFLVAHTGKTLLVSGYEHKNPHHMVYFYGPLSQVLAASGRFSRIEVIGSHSDVTVFRCNV